MTHPRRSIRRDEPGDTCFGCGHRNEEGLRMVFEHEPGGDTHASYEVPDRLCGPRGIVHGGIQATLLDEVLGVAVYEYHVDRGEDEADFVTADFQLHYRGPVPTETPLRMRARVVRSEGRDTWAEGEILSRDDRPLTQATARWRRLRTS